MTASASTPRRFGGFSLFFSFVALLTGVAIYVWSGSQSPFKTWVLVPVLLMLLCASVLPFVFGLGHAIVCFMLSLVALICSLQAAHYKTPLSGAEIAGLSLSSCVKDHVENQIKTKGPIDNEGIEEIKDLCEFIAKTKTPEYQSKKILADLEREKAAESQLKGLSASAK